MVVKQQHPRTVAHCSLALYWTSTGVSYYDIEGCNHVLAYEYCIENSYYVVYAFQTRNCVQSPNAVELDSTQVPIPVLCTDDSSRRWCKPLPT